jgi:beta-phosphoglucomutase
MGYLGAIFDVDGVLVDSPHELAWPESLWVLMENDWRDIRAQTTHSPEVFTRPCTRRSWPACPA